MRKTQIGLGLAAWFILGAACGDDAPKKTPSPDMAPSADMATQADMSTSADMEADMWTPPAEWTYTPPDWTTPPDSEELWLEARMVDPMASLEADMEHGIFVPRGQRRPELFVMFPGSGGRPRNNKKILQTAARAGYISIGLAYPSELSSSDACDGSPDKDCQEKFRREKLHAEPQLDIIDIKAPDAIVPRLVTLLKRLHQQRPNVGFDAYYSGDELVWDKLVLSGFSQGSGHASYLAMEHKIARLVLFSSGADNIVYDIATNDYEQAPWVLKPRATPPSRHFGILHSEDVFFVKEEAYKTYGMPRYGGFINPEDAPPPYGYTHMLVTDAEPSQGNDRYHNSLATDAFMPDGPDGLPLMKDAHYYMFTAPIPED